MLSIAPTLAIALFGSCLVGVAQEGQASLPGSEPEVPLSAPQQSDRDAPSFTFKAVTRMVILGVVARDSEDNPVRDLTAKDLVVSEKLGDSPEITEKIASFQAVNEAAAEQSTQAQGVVLGWLHKSFCGLAGTYELAYYLSPESRKDGLHHIAVTSSRPGVKLYFRQGYKIDADKSVQVSAGELTDKQSSIQLQKQKAFETQLKKHPDLDLAGIACFDRLHTTAFQLDVNKVNANPRAGAKSVDATYEFVVPGSYFASLPTPERNSPRRLDFAVCTFESSGHPLRYVEGTVHAGTKPEEAEMLGSRGFANMITFEPQPPPSPAQPPVVALSARLVVRDRDTGSLGSGEMLLRPIPESLNQFRAPIPEGKTTSSFGTTTPDTHALCDDVYELTPWTTILPRFSELDAIAPVYSTSLGVFTRFFTEGIPGVTDRTEWFGVNYHGVFSVDKLGKYEFDLLSDDGAKVYVDDKLIVSDDTVHPAQRSRGSVMLTAGSHDIRVSYFHGPRTEVALILLVKTHGAAWRLFDTREFPGSEDPATQRTKLPLPPK
jgi:hypothetical protein